MPYGYVLVEKKFTLIKKKCYFVVLKTVIEKKKCYGICFINRYDCIKWRLWLQREKLWIVTIICQKSCNIYMKLITIMFDNQSGQKIYDSCKIFSIWWFAIKIATFFPPCLVKLHKFSIHFLQRIVCVIELDRLNYYIGLNLGIKLCELLVRVFAGSEK